MHSLPLSKIANIDKELPLIIQSVEGGSYLAMTELDNQRLPVTDSDGQLIRAANVSQLQSALSGYRWASVCLMQSAAYDEMIGNQPENGPEFEIPLSWSIDNC